MRFSAEDRLVLFTFAFFTSLFPRACRATNPQAVSVPFGPNFLGYDGLWSPAQIRVGTPEQYLLVFPSTVSSETWVAGPGLCTDPTCASRRGGIFYTGNSTTWRPLGQYELGYSALTETTQVGTYGFDNISISDTLSASNQIVAVVDNIQQWNGELGMGVAETRFTNNTNYLPFLSTLVQNDSAIPSHSYSYTAGASYKGSGLPGSLTLGGVDSIRYVSNSFSFALANGNIPTVALKSMQLSASSQPTNWSSNPLQLMPQNLAGMFTIDSSTPYLWLPETVCENIAQALSLTWDADLELYVLASGTAQDRVNMGLEFTFDLAVSLASNELIALKVSYDAFNLQLSYPYPGLTQTYSTETLPYFPMRRANNTLQYTIGRAFLQEIYLIVNYEANSFSLSQALFPDSNQQPQLAPIPRPSDSIWPGPAGSETSAGSSIGAKVGIAVAAIVVVGVIAALAWFCCIRKRRNKLENNDKEKPHKGSILSLLTRRSTHRSSASSVVAELYADRRHPTEMNSDASNSRFELSGSAPVEMPAAEVAPAFFQERHNAIITQRNDPRTPIELVQPPSRSSVSKDGIRVTTTEQNPLGNARAYSPAEIDQRYRTVRTNQAGISPDSTRRSGDLFHGGSDHVISPITGGSSDLERSSRGNTSQTRSDASRYLSPVSPTQAQSEGQISPQLGSQHASSGVTRAGDQTNRTTLSPIPNSNLLPRRSASRDSRFREELIENAEAQTPSDPTRNSRANKGDARSSSRFSWEK